MNPIDMTLWQGRTDSADGALGQRWHQIIRAHNEQTESSVALLGFACDAGVARNHGRVGASAGPAALRRTLANIPAPTNLRVVDAGDVACIDDALENAQQNYANKIAGLLQHHHFPIGLGGGHEIAYASFCGLAQYTQAHLKPAQKPSIGIINLDAHFDLRADARASSGTPFRQIAEDCAAHGWDFNYCCLGVSKFANTQALFERAKQLNVTYLLDEHMLESNLHASLDVLQAFIHKVDVVYFTLCLDVLPAAVMPAVSAPAARGVSMAVVESLLDAVCTSGKLKLFDVAEFNPNFDIDNQGARVAARLVARVAHRMHNQNA